MKCLFDEKSDWIKDIYINPTEEQEKEIVEINIGLRKKISEIYVNFDFLPQIGMIIDLQQFNEVFNFTENELSFIDGDPFHFIVDIEIRPNCLVLVFDWDNEADNEEY